MGEAPGNEYGVDNHGVGRVTSWYARGGKVPFFRKNIESILKDRCHILILQIGVNDLDDRPKSESEIFLEIAMQIFQLAQKFLKADTNRPERVIICQAFKRFKWRKISIAQGNERVRQLNFALRAMCADVDNIYFWFHRGLWQPLEPIFKPKDNIHLNDIGNHRLFLSMRRAIMGAADNLVGND